MGLNLHFRHKVEFALLFFMIVFGFAAGSPMDADPQWIGWAVMTGILFILIIIDFMFLNDKDFVYEPDIKVSQA